VVEGVVVVLVVCILGAIAIPAFAGNTRRADDKVTQQDVRTAVKAATAFSATRHTFTGVGAALPTTEPSLVFAPGSVALDDGRVYVQATATTAYIGKVSRSGNCYYARSTGRGTTVYGHAQSGCAAVLDMTTDVEWAKSWAAAPPSFGH
jgi:type II secretory pathway pseudopilin PulG